MAALAKPGDAVGHLADGAVAAAGIEPERFAGLRTAAWPSPSAPPGLLGQQALAPPDRDAARSCSAIS